MVMKHYNSIMGGVYHASMLCALYGHDRKLKKWWHRLFFGMMDITLVNSVNVFCKLVQKISLLDFTRSMVGRLLVHNSVSKKSGHRQQVVALDAALANRGSHWPQFSDNSTYNFASYHGRSPQKPSN